MAFSREGYIILLKPENGKANLSKQNHTLPGYCICLPFVIQNTHYIYRKGLQPKDGTPLTEFD
jgi:hypothetical protein